MKQILKIIITIFILGIIYFLFRFEIDQIILSLKLKYFPCENPITYSLGTFDEKFGISKEEFLNTINIAEKTWEESIDKELFSYTQNGDLKINLIYDIRQEASQKLNDIGISVSDSKTSYEELKSQYNSMQNNYNNLKKEFEDKIVSLQNRQSDYQDEVIFLNNNGGAGRDEFNRLNKEKKSIDAEIIEINKLQTELNTYVSNINALVVVLNRLVSSLNIQVKKYNTIGEELGGEFEEGTYKEGPEGREIDIYQFDNKDKLARVLTHEFGHALGLEHIENPEAVMYRLNNGVNEKLTVDDVLALKALCEI